MTNESIRKRCRIPVARVAGCRARVLVLKPCVIGTRSTSKSWDSHKRDGSCKFRETDPQRVEKQSTYIHTYIHTYIRTYIHILYLIKHIMPGRINTNNVREMTQGSEMITTSVKNIHFQSMSMAWRKNAVFNPKKYNFPLFFWRKRISPRQ